MRTIKGATLFLLIAAVLLVFAGAAAAVEVSGEVTAVDVETGVLTLKSGSVEVGFDCEAGSLIKDVKVGDLVTVVYKEAGGKKVATKVTPKKMKAPAGY